MEFCVNIMMVEFEDEGESCEEDKGERDDSPSHTLPHTSPTYH